VAALNWGDVFDLEALQMSVCAAAGPHKATVASSAAVAHENRTKYRFISPPLSLRFLAFAYVARTLLLKLPEELTRTGGDCPAAILSRSPNWSLPARRDTL
jgi:hypothetical protein